MWWLRTGHNGEVETERGATHYVAVNICINCSFFTFIIIINDDTIEIMKTRSSAAAKRLCDCCRVSVLAKCNWQTIFCRRYRSVFNHCDVISLQSYHICWNKANKGYYAVQGHSRSPMLVPIESPYATSYQWLTLTDILSRTVLKLSQITDEFWTLCVFWDPLLWRGLRSNTRFSSEALWKARSGLLIHVN